MHLHVCICVAAKHESLKRSRTHEALNMPVCLTSLHWKEMATAPWQSQSQHLVLRIVVGVVVIVVFAMVCCGCCWFSLLVGPGVGSVFVAVAVAVAAAAAAVALFVFVC